MPVAIINTRFYSRVLFFEQKIEALHITRSMQDRADKLADEMEAVNEQLQPDRKTFRIYPFSCTAGIFSMEWRVMKRMKLQSENFLNPDFLRLKPAAKGILRKPISVSEL